MCKKYAKVVQLVLILGLQVYLSCSNTASPPGMEPQEAIVVIKTNLSNYCHAKTNALNKTRQIDQVLVTVLGFRTGAGTVPEQFTLVNQHELKIDQANNSAEGEITVPLGSGDPVAATIVVNGKTKTVVGEKIQLEVELLENDQVIISGHSEPFVIAPGIINVAPPLIIETVIASPDGDQIGTISVGPNPVIAFSTFWLQAEIDSGYQNDIMGVRVSFKVSTIDTTLFLRRSEQNPNTFTAEIIANFLGFVRFNFLALNQQQQEIALGKLYLHSVINPEKTGMARSITTSGVFDIAIGLDDRSFKIIWTDDDTTAAITMNRLLVAQTDINTLWEIKGQAIKSGVTFGRVPEAAEVIIPTPPTDRPFIKGEQYYIRIERDREFKNDIAVMYFTYDP